MSCEPGKLERAFSPVQLRAESTRARRRTSAHAAARVLAHAGRDRKAPRCREWHSRSGLNVPGRASPDALNAGASLTDATAGRWPSRDKDGGGALPTISGARCLRTHTVRVACDPLRDACRRCAAGQVPVRPRRSDERIRGQAADGRYLGRVRRHGRTPQRRLRWLLVHVVSHDERRQGAHLRRQPLAQAPPRRGGPRARGPGL